LRRNPLVAAYFSSELKGVARTRADSMLANAIRNAVRRCADACLQSDRLADDENAAHVHAIVVECDLGGMSRSALAAKIGISARHYTRLQHGIRRRIAVQLTSELRRAASSVDDGCAAVASPLPSIALLAAKGATAQAHSQLVAIVNSGGEARLIASALCLQALIRHRYLGDSTGARDALLASQSVAEKVPLGDHSRLPLVAEIELTSIEIDASAGRFDSATERSTSVARMLEQSDGAARWLRLRALTWAAYCYFVQGAREETRRYLGGALSEAGSAASAPAPERVEFSLTAAVVLAELGRFEESSRILADATILARGSGLALDVLRLDLMHAMIALECGRVSSATQRLAEICRESRRLSNVGLTAQSHAYLARAQMRSAQPRPGDIMENARRVLELTPNDYAAWTDAKIAESFARLILHDHVGAELAARAADDAAVKMGHRLYRGSTLRELARVAHAQGRKRDAKRAIIGAVDASYGVGKPQQAADALELAAQILQQPDYRYEASVLRGALRLSGI
jgi:tetratricopeptide (TPR) repeat protein